MGKDAADCGLLSTGRKEGEQEAPRVHNHLMLAIAYEDGRCHLVSGEGALDVARGICYCTPQRYSHSLLGSRTACLWPLTLLFITAPSVWKADEAERQNVRQGRQPGFLKCGSL